MIGPFERLGHGAVIVFDKGQYFAFQFVARGKVATFEHLAHQNAEPNLHLVHPGSVLGGVVKDDLVGRIAQKSRPRGFGFQDAAFALDAQIIGNAGFGSDIAHQTLGEMGVEVVADVVPFADFGFSGRPALYMREEVLFSPCRLGGDGGHLASGYIEVEGEGQRAMADVFELAPFDLARLQRQARVFAFQGLHAGHLIQAFDAFALFCQGWRLTIQRIDIIDFVLKLVVMLGGEPVTVQMRFDLGIFLKDVPRGGVRWTRLYLAG